jgi:amino acid permease
LAYGGAQFGLVLAVVFMAISCFLTLLSLNVLAMLALEFKAVSPRERLTFASVSCMILPRFGWVLDASVLILCSGAMIAYLSNSSNLFAQAFYSIFQWDLTSLSLRSTSFVCAAAMLLCILPLSLSRRMSSTTIASIFGLSCIFYIVFMTMFYSPCTAAKTDFAKLLRPAGIFQVFATFPVMVFCYACQFSVFHIVNELQDANRTRLNLVFVTALVTCSSIYAVSMLLPFLTFGADVKQSFLQSIRRPDGSQEIPLIVAFIFAGLALSVSYALMSLPVRVSILTFVFGNKQPDGSREVRWRVFIVICIILVSFGCSAALGDNLSLPIEIAGLLGGNTLGFVFPFTLYLKHYGLKNDKPLLSMAVLMSLVFCCLLYPICLVGIFSPSNF